MAINETVQDLENYPSKTKTITLDIKKIIPIDNEGDEVYVGVASTTATKIGGGTIDPINIREFKVGYCKSSGFVEAPFTIASGNNQLKVSIDGSPERPIILSSGVGLTGDDIARDLQAQISALAAVSGIEDRNPAFLNCTVSFKNNRLVVIAGSLSNTYTGIGKTSVNVLPGDAGSADATLGFDKKIVSEELASKQATETLLSSSYSTGTDLTVESIAGFSDGYACTITDGVNREYFVVSGSASNTLTMVGSGLVNTYDAGSIIQRIFERDPSADLASPLDTIDDFYRFALKSIANQINFAV